MDQDRRLGRNFSFLLFFFVVMEIWLPAHVFGAHEDSSSVCAALLARVDDESENLSTIVFNELLPLMVGTFIEPQSPPEESKSNRQSRNFALHQTGDSHLVQGTGRHGALFRTSFGDSFLSLFVFHYLANENKQLESPETPAANVQITFDALQIDTPNEDASFYRPIAREIPYLQVTHEQIERARGIAEKLASILYLHEDLQGLEVHELSADEQNPLNPQYGPSLRVKLKLLADDERGSRKEDFYVSFLGTSTVIYQVAHLTEREKLLAGGPVSP